MNYVIRSNNLRIGSRRVSAAQLIERGSIGVNFHVSESVAGLGIPQIANHHDSSQCPSGLVHARQLHTFASLSRGAFVTTRTSTSDGSQRWLAGRVTEGYKFREAIYEGHPHVLTVCWGEFLPEETTIGGQMTIQQLPNYLIEQVQQAADSTPPHSPRPEIAVSQASRSAPALAKRNAAVLPPPPTSARPVWDEPCDECDSIGYDHRFLLRPAPVAPGREGGHDVLIVGLNPSRPDVGAGATLRGIRDLLDEMQARSGGVVNLLSRRSSDPDEIPRPETHPHNNAHLAAAVAQASVVLCAWGGNISRVAHGMATSAEDHFRQIIEVSSTPAFTLGSKPYHPRHWATRPREYFGKGLEGLPFCAWPH